MTFDTSVYSDAVNVLQDLSSTRIEREFSARILYQGHKGKHWLITSNAGEKKTSLLDVNMVRGPWILGIEGFSELGISTRLASSDKREQFKKASEIFKKRNIDYALLIDHIDTGRDWFIAEDTDFLKH